jgi:hypothetical protein
MADREEIALSPEDALQRWPNTIAEKKRRLASEEEDLPDRSVREESLRNLEARLAKLKKLVKEDTRLGELFRSTQGAEKRKVGQTRSRNSTYISWVLDPKKERRDKAAEAQRSKNKRDKAKQREQSNAAIAVSRCW